MCANYYKTNNSPKGRYYLLPAKDKKNLCANPMAGSYMMGF